MKEQVKYIKCPRCELNYILKKDKFCDVCKSEMKAGILEENDFDEMEEGMELCPICKVNYINEGERMCTTCLEEQLSTSRDDEPDWRGFVEKADEEDDDMDLLPIEEDDEIDEELEGAFAKDLDGDFDDMEEDEESDEVDIHDDFDDSMSDDFDDDFDGDDEEEFVDEEDDDLI